MIMSAAAINAKLNREDELAAQAKLRMVPVTMGVHTYYMVLDAAGYPVAQGTQVLCERVLEQQGK